MQIRTYQLSVGDQRPLSINARQVQYLLHAIEQHFSYGEVQHPLYPVKVETHEQPLFTIEFDFGEAVFADYPDLLDIEDNLLCRIQNGEIVLAPPFRVIGHEEQSTP